MNRRQFISSTAAAATLAAVATAAQAHDHHDHAARAAAGHCVAAGQVCLNHCITLLSSGDTSMKDCAVAVNQMLALCGAIQNLAAQNSRLTPALAKVCVEACKQCAQACKAHAAHHAECKACYESCLNCIQACEKIAAYPAACVAKRSCEAKIKRRAGEILARRFADDLLMIGKNGGIWRGIKPHLLPI